MRRLIFECTMTVLLLAVSLNGQAQTWYDVKTGPVLSADQVMNNVRNAALTASMAAEANRMEELADVTAEWYVIADSIQQGMRKFGQGYEEKNDSTETTAHSPFEYFWLVKGLWKNIREMVGLYNSYLNEFENDGYRFTVGALQEETKAVFSTQCMNTLDVFNNMLVIIRDQSKAKPRMTVVECYSVGEEMNLQVLEINKALKWHLRKIRDYAVMNNPMDPFGKTGTRNNGDFDPERY